MTVAKKNVYNYCPISVSAIGKWGTVGGQFGGQLRQLIALPQLTVDN